MFLVLTRRKGETVVIGNDVRVTIAGVNRGVVRLAIAAPKDVPVDREEIAVQKALETVPPWKEPYHECGGEG